MNLRNIFKRDTPRPKQAKRRRVVARYDITKGRNEAGGQKREIPRIETGAEEEQTGGGLTPYNRLKAIAAARNQYRNSPQFRGMVKTFQNNCVGSEAKLRFYEADETATGDAYRAAERFFNGRWSHHASFADGASFRDCLKAALTALLVDGDFVAVYDDGCITGSGKLLFFEADQIANLDTVDFARYAERGYSQNSGVIHDAFGRECGVIVSSKRGQTSVKAENAFVLTKDPDSDIDPNWVLVKSRSRLNQTRGIPDALSTLSYCQDAHEGLLAELQTSKLAASRYASIVEPPTPETTHAPAGFGDDEPEEEEEEEEKEEYSADGLMQYCGGNVDVFGAGTTVQMDAPTRPNNNLAVFLENVVDHAGAGLGLSHCYTQSRADTSYTAARFDSLLAWRTFSSIQQFMEDSLMDWVARWVLRSAMERGDIPHLPEGWETEISWSFPRMQSLDELKDIQAAAQRLKNGLTTYATELGPNWRDSLKQLAAELEYAKAHGLPLNIFETAAGAMAEPQQEPQTNTEENPNET